MDEDELTLVGLFLMFICYITLLFSVCSTADKNTQENTLLEKAEQIVKSDRYEFQMVKIDGCEYMYCDRIKTICHKGNCSNPIHKPQLEGE